NSFKKIKNTKNLRAEYALKYKPFTIKGIGLLYRILYLLINEGIESLDSSSGKWAMKEKCKCFKSFFLASIFSMGATSICLNSKGSKYGDKSRNS
ncbi:hypothetical protein P9386_15760, partial [Caldifermentibacillus hisashii]|uniref:hypothetical protein n=1 Tax=Caldifermentibacillus hisashii TaxID=996558 RepID=UPI002E230E35|nr:hypothetical protein [Caldifermentibacillus hisashii]